MTIIKPFMLKDFFLSLFEPVERSCSAIFGFCTYTVFAFVLFLRDTLFIIFHITLCCLRMVYDVTFWTFQRIYNPDAEFEDIVLIVAAWFFAVIAAMTAFFFVTCLSTMAICLGGAERGWQVGFSAGQEIFDKIFTIDMHIPWAHHLMTYWDKNACVNWRFYICAGLAVSDQLVVLKAAAHLLGYPGNLRPTFKEFYRSELAETKKKFPVDSPQKRSFFVANTPLFLAAVYMFVTFYEDLYVRCKNLFPVEIELPSVVILTDELTNQGVDPVARDNRQPEGMHLHKSPSWFKLAETNHSTIFYNSCDLTQDLAADCLEHIDPNPNSFYNSPH